jgi:hypothetical protein
MADFLSHYMDNNTNMYEDTQNSGLPLNQDHGHGDFVLSCIDTQSENSQTFEFMKFHNSNKKETNLEVIREEDSIFNHIQQDYEDYEDHNKKHNKDHLNSNKVMKSTPLEKKELLATNNKNKAGNSSNHSNNLTEKIKKISQEIDDIYEETQKSESVKTKDLGAKDISSVYTMNKGSSFQPANMMGNFNQNNLNNLNSMNNMNNMHGHAQGQNFQSAMYVNNFNQANQTSSNSNNPNNLGSISMNNSLNNNMLPSNKPFTPNNFLPAQNNNNNHYQNPKLNLLNSLNPNNNSSIIPNNSGLNHINKTKGKVNLSNNSNNNTMSNVIPNNFPGNINNNSASSGFYSDINAPIGNKSISYPPNKNNYELSNSFRIETEENIKKAVAIFDNIKLNFCNFIENYKNKFVHDAEMIKHVLVAETDHIIQEEEKNRLIDARMETLFRDMMNILNEFQPRY